MYQTNTLSSKYFQTILTEEHDGHTLKVIRPTGRPLILFSKVDGSPLASVHLNCNGGFALFTKRPNKSQFKCDFQGIVDSDDREFELVITNLSKEGHINFNILKHDEKVNTVNPGGLNEVNELRPYESYSVQCDQETGKALILSTIKKSTSEGKQEKVTVGEAEASSESKPAGTYYFLSVVPELSKAELVGKFKDTKWDCKDLFYLKEKTISNKYEYPEPGSSGWSDLENRLYNRRNIRNSSGLFDDRMGITDTGFGQVGSGYRSSMARCGSGHARTRLFAQPAGGSLEEYCDAVRECTTKMDKSGGDSGGDSEEEEEAEEANMSFSLHDECEQCEPKSMCISLDTPIDINTIGTSLKNASLDLPEDFIKESYATKVGAGRDIVVNSTETGIEYSFDTPCEACVIGLSISDKLKINSEPDNKDLLEEAKLIVADLIKNHGKDLLAKLEKLFESEECAICLEGKKDGRVLDTVFYQCGHQCCHSDCSTSLRKCPLCRTHISASIRVDS